MEALEDGLGRGQGRGGEGGAGGVEEVKARVREAGAVVTGLSGASERPGEGAEAEAG